MIEYFGGGRIPAALLVANRTRILSATIYLRDIVDFAAMNAIWELWIAAGIAPARTTVEARLASPSLLVEVTVVAASGRFGRFRLRSLGCGR